MPGESMCFDARIRYWEEEWLSQLLEEALRLKGKASPDEEESSEGEQSTKTLTAGRLIVSSD
ncbi:MAG: hypothetical protein JSV90_03960 [Methanobacteriota archaeon]|nr:MAG: hypothetical protein JSV90_03960 [Euryarchaeota archaeon]